MCNQHGEILRLTFGAKSLALGDLAHEISFLFLQIGREPFILSLLNRLLDFLTLLGPLSLGLFLDRACESSVMALQ